jgi:hypothetical protein
MFKTLKYLNPATFPENSSGGKVNNWQAQLGTLVQKNDNPYLAFHVGMVTTSKLEISFRVLFYHNHEYLPEAHSRNSYC